jgi:hypothetical protein
MSDELDARRRPVLDEKSTAIRIQVLGELHRSGLLSDDGFDARRAAAVEAIQY